MIALIDESYPETASGTTLYIVTAVVVVPDEAEIKTALDAVVHSPGRVRGFHWAKEGPEARSRMLDCLEAIGAAAQVRICPTGRSGTVRARSICLQELVECVVLDGITELIIESSDSTMNQRDRMDILDVLRVLGLAGSISYDHRTKEEPLLWLADATCGVVADHLKGNGSEAFERLVASNVLPSDITYVTTPQSRNA